jgi:TPR repeat protein
MSLIAEEAGLPLPDADASGEELLRMALLYSTGQGGAPLDYVSAHMLFNLAAMRGSEEAKSYRRELSQEMAKDDIAEAQRAARAWIDAAEGRLAPFVRAALRTTTGRSLSVRARLRALTFHFATLIAAPRQASRRVCVRSRRIWIQAGPPQVAMCACGPPSDQSFRRPRTRSAST